MNGYIALKVEEHIAGSAVEHIVPGFYPTKIVEVPLDVAKEIVSTYAKKMDEMGYGVSFTVELILEETNNKRLDTAEDVIEEFDLKDFWLDRNDENLEILNRQYNYNEEAPEFWYTDTQAHRDYMASL